MKPEIAQKQWADLETLLPKVTEEPLADTGHHFVDGMYCDLTQCSHGDTGYYRNKEDGQAIAILWNLWKAGKLQLVTEEPSPKLEITRPETIRQYREALAAHAVTLPITSTDEGAVDAAGRDVFTIDVNNERPDTQVGWIAGLIVVAVNTCGGFKAQVTEGTSGAN